MKFVSGSEKLKDKARLTSVLKLTADFPDDVPTRILRRGLLSCSVVTASCQFVLYDVADVKSVE